MMNELVAFYEARLDEDEQAAQACAGAPWGIEVPPMIHVSVRAHQESKWKWGKLGYVATVERDEDRTHIARHDPARVLADIAADRKLIARYQAAVESHEEALKALQDARKYGGDEDVFHAAAEDVAAAHARAGAFLTILEDRAARFADHEDYQPHWRQP